MKKFLKWFAGIILFLTLIYLIGPKPSKPKFEIQTADLPTSVTDLEKQINVNEKKVVGLKADNEARIVWFDSLKKEKTKIAILYLHGLLASPAEGDPVHRDIAKKYNANLYIARLAEHGIEGGDSTMINLTADKLIGSSETAYQIAKKLGDEVVLIGTSTGGALSLYLASRHPEIKAIVLFSPCIRLSNPAAALLNKPWGLQIVSLVSGSTIRDTAESEAHAKYWTLNYRMEAVMALVNLYYSTMEPELFSKVNCPVFMGYYYKNENEQDPTASVADMLKMYEGLGTPSHLKRKIAFPNAGAHVIASPIRSKDSQGVERETDNFLREIVGM